MDCCGEDERGFRLLVVDDDGEDEIC